MSKELPHPLVLNVLPCLNIALRSYTCQPIQKKITAYGIPSFHRVVIAVSGGADTDDASPDPKIDLITDHFERRAFVEAKLEYLSAFCFHFQS